MVNIFACDPDPFQAARYIDDKRLGKLGMEATQLMQFAFTLGTDDGRLAPSSVVFTRVSKTYAGHGVARWVRASVPNLCWTLLHTMALFRERTQAYGTTHATERVVDAILEAVVDKGFYLATEAEHHAFPHNSAANQDLGLDFKHLPVYEAYRTYLPRRWATDVRKATFKNREAPVISREGFLVPGMSWGHGGQASRNSSVSV
ncbi:MAG: hypothetical protein EBS54_04745 [Betaproteobacteria bacterium]|nr:hypothetical protein [Betaproteobacteria bacterium]